MRWVVLSDVHANLPALRSVEQHAKNEGVGGFIFTGDLIVYGPHPNECVNLLFELLGEDGWEKSGVKGNNDKALETRQWQILENEELEKSSKWTEDVITQQNRSLINNLSEKPLTLASNITIFHGTLSDPMGQFSYLNDEIAIKDTFRKLQTPIGLFGHTHMQIVCSSTPKPLPSSFAIKCDHPETQHNSDYQEISVVEFALYEEIQSGKKVLINAGSIGQPSGPDPRAAFMIFDDEKSIAQFVRVPYDIEAVVADLEKVGETSKSKEWINTLTRRLRKVGPTVP